MFSSEFRKKRVYLIWTEYLCKPVPNKVDDDIYRGLGKNWMLLESNLIAVPVVPRQTQERFW